MGAKVIKTKDGLNGKGGKVGKIALVKCLQCAEQNWIPFSKIKNGGGKFCSKKCYSIHQKTITGEKHNNWKGGVSSTQNGINWRAKYPEKHTNWRKKNKDKLNEYNRNRYSNNPMIRLNNNIKGAIYRCLLKKKNFKHWEDIVDYSIADLKKHLYLLFDKKMNWNNYGKYWEIDHIIPKSRFEYGSYLDEQFKKCWALKNLQPLEKTENRKKYNKYPIS